MSQEASTPVRGARLTLRRVCQTTTGLLSSVSLQLICKPLQAVAAWCVMRELCPSEGEVPGIYRSIGKAVVCAHLAPHSMNANHYHSVQLKLWNLARARVRMPCHHSI